MTGPVTFRLALAVLGTALSVAVASAAVSASVVAVTQSGRAFGVRQVQINAGDTLRFLNADSFIHHIFIRSDKMTFDSDEQEPGKAVDVLFPAPGSFVVRCEIHPKMLLQVDVR